MPGRASRKPDYIAGVLLAARRWNLPDAAIARLERFAAEAGVVAGSSDAVASAPKARPTALRHAV